MALFVHTSNRIERLADALAREGLAPPPDDPFLPEWIVVNSRGMESWLRQQVTERLGVTANLRLPFLTAFLEELVGRHPDLRSASAGRTGAFSRAVMHWRIYDALAQSERWGGDLHAYVAGGGHPELRRHQLAGRLAHLFDEYQVYRPDLLAGWQRGAPPRDWQARLWRHLRETSTEPSWAEALGTLAAASSELDLRGLRRVSVFGLSTLPPLFLDVVAALAQRVDVRLFLLEPSTPAAEAAHPLLQAWGSLGRQFQGLLAARPEVQWLRTPVAAQGPTLLAQLQRDVLEGSTPTPDRRPPVDPADRSVALHACHGPQREVEVLHDQLLDLFAKDPTLTPRDVIVMAPDISAYAAHVDAVFDAGRRHGAPPPIPYSISDRLDVAEGQAFQALVALLGLSGSRFKVTELLDLLALPAVHASFGLGDEDLGLVADWAQQTGIHWGFDAAHRQEFELPPRPDGTWAAGLERLLAGYAMAPDATSPSAGVYLGITAHPDVEGSLATALGRLCEFVARARQVALEVRQPRPLPAWRDWISTTVLDGFFGSADQTTALEVHRLRAGLDDLVATAGAAGFTGELPVEVLTEQLRGGVGASLSGGGFFRGKVTFCSLLPMRSVPARVICLLGLDDGTFPRRDQALGFDLMAATPRAGDRSRRADDRYLFLEALLAARERLYLSYTGRRRADNTRLAPSILVTELLEATREGYALPPDRVSAFDGSKLWFAEVEHRLQPFNREYFTRNDEGLFSYSSSNGRGARGALGGVEPPPFFPTGPDAPALPDPPADDASFRALTPRRLAEFLAAPCAFLLESRLGLRRATGAGQNLRDDEFEDDDLHRWRIRDHVLRSELARDEREACWAWLVGMGWYVDQPADRGAFEREWRRARTFLDTPSVPTGRGPAPLAAVLSAPAAALDVALTVPSGGQLFEVRGTVGPVVDAVAVDHRYGRAKTKDRLVALVSHLCLAASGHDVTTATVRVSTPERRPGLPVTYACRPAGQAEAACLVADLVDRYRRGLCRPLPFDLDCAEAYRKAPDAPEHPPFTDRAGPVYRCLGPEGPWPFAEFRELSDLVFGLLERFERKVTA